jgi:hypothetical protein
MARTVKARSEAVDNMYSGVVGELSDRITSRERTIDGALPPDFTTWGNSENIASGVDYSADENLVEAGTNLLATERRGA